MKRTIISNTLLFEGYKNKLQITSLHNGKHIICIDKIDYKDLKKVLQNEFTYKQ